MADRTQKKAFYKIILLFALLDFAFGTISMAHDNLTVQISALVITAVTLGLSIVFAIKYPQKKRADVVMLVVGGLDFITTLISVLVIVLATQIVALIASGFTVLKVIKIIVQSKKATNILNATRPFLSKIFCYAVPSFGAWYLKQKSKGVKTMEKIKNFFTKVAQLIRANKISLSGTALNGGVWGALGYLVNQVESLALNVGGFNITPLFSILGFALIELCFYWESFGVFMARISPKIAKKLEERKAKEAEEKALLEELERTRILEEIKAEQEKQEAEAKAQLEEQEKQRQAELARIKREEEDRLIAEWKAKKQATETLIPENQPIETAVVDNSAQLTQHVAENIIATLQEKKTI